MLLVPELSNSAITAEKRPTFGEQCLTEEELSSKVLSLSEPYSKAQETASFLRESARQSRTCRQQIIASVMKAMDKPHLDISRDQASDDLWREGARLLGDLKAAEALDLLLSHITMNDHEWSVTMVHQPAIEGIIRMGPIAIPKLTVMVQKNTDREVRQDAVYCLAWIGGASARRVLEQVFPIESDPCVKHFIRVSINTMDKSGRLRNDQGQWLSAFLCNGSEGLK